MRGKSSPSHKATTRLLLILITLVYSLIFIPITAMAPMALMGFDAPGSEQQPEVWVAVIGFLTLPLMLLIAMILPWWFYRRKSYPKAIIISCLPFINVIAIAAVFAFNV